MRTYEEKEVTRKHKVTSAIICDLCRKKNPLIGYDEDNWNEELYEIAKTTVSIEIGTSYPEGGSSTIRRMDICPECFETKLIPWLQSQGVVMTETELDW